LRLRVRRKTLGLALLLVFLAFMGANLVVLNLEKLLLNPQNLVIYGMDTFYAGSKGSIRTLVLDKLGDRPVEGAQVTLKLRNGSQEYALGSGSTNRLGTNELQFQVPSLPPGEYTLVVEAHSGLGVDKVESRIKVTADVKALLTTDKPIYKSGEEAQIRVLVLRLSDLTPYLGAVTLELEDPKGNKLFKKTLETSRFGVANASFQFADELILGRYTVRARLGDAQFERKIEVKRYVLPKFEVDLTTDREYYLPGETLRGVVNARYFFGKPVDGSLGITAFTYEVTSKTIATINGRTDADGSFSFELRLPSYFVGLPLEQGKGLLLLNITVTDSAEHSETVTRSLPIASSALMLEVIPESRTAKQGVENNLFVLSYYPDGTPAPSTLTVNGKSLRTDEAGFATVKVVPPAKENFEVLVTAEDAKGHRAWVQKTLTVEAGPEQIRILSDRSVFKAGEVASLGILYSGQSGGGSVYVDVVKGKQTMLTKALELTDNSAVFELPLSHDMTGVLEVHAYKILSSEDIIRDSKKLLVNPADDLKLHVTFDQPVYRPGGEAKIDFQVTDATGAGSPAVIGVDVVDEAVFALEELQPGLEKVYLLLESELMKPRYEIHGYTLPETYEILQKENRTQGEEARVQSVGNLLTAGGGDAHYGLKLFSYAVKEQGVARMKNAYFAAVIGVLKTAAAVAGVTFFLPLFFLFSGQAPFALFASIPYVLLVFLIIRVARRRSARKGVAIAAILVMLTLISAAGVAYWTAGITAAFTRTQPDTGITEQFGAPSAITGGTSNVPVFSSEAGKGGGAAPKPQAEREQPRLRQFFPETMYSNPQVITDEEGRASITVPVADSITSWRLTALASGLRGEMGSTVEDLLVFQDFFVDLDLPIALTQGDEVSIPVAVYNYLNESQTVELRLEPEDWFTIKGPSSRTLKVDASEVTVAFFTFEAKEVGVHKLTVYAYGEKLSDAVQRSIEVVPDGEEIRVARTDRLNGTITETLVIPEEAVENASRLFVKVYPGVFAQIVEGLDSMLHMPFGCFEQTSSITYPNVLALEYMKRTGKVTPEIQMKAEGYINVGYQRLLGFEVAGGGFDWFGNPPAKLILTSYGLMEFYDMAKVYTVDVEVIMRTQNWIASNQNADGSYEPEGALHASYRTESKLTATAYVLWALTHTGYQGAAVDRAVEYAVGQMDLKGVEDPYTLALLANALIGARHPAAGDVLDELYARRVEENDEVYWNSSPSVELRTFAGALGQSKDLETTALATLAFLRADYRPETAQRALNFVIRAKGSWGHWGSTQATIYALKALLLALEKSHPEGNAAVEITANGVKAETLRIDEENNDVLRIVDLKAYVRKGENTVSLEVTGEGNLYYQVVAVYYLPWREEPAIGSPEISIDVAYDTTNLTVGDVVTATVKVAYHGLGSAEMVIIDLGVPPGFAVERADLDRLVGSLFAKYDIRGRQVILYVEKLEGEMEFSYRLRAMFPITAKTPSSEVYKYYQPEVKAVTTPVVISVS